MVFVIAKDKTKLMPTTEYRARKLLKSNKATIYCHSPFTIMLTHNPPGVATGEATQPIELCLDPGETYIGVSAKSEKHEYVHAQFDTLTDEKQRHDDCRMYRRNRRNRKRYRKPRFDNRKIEKGWLAPTIRHKLDNHIRVAKKYADICPIMSITVEVGSFDTQVLKAVEEGRPLPKGTDYQRGEKYGYYTLREAVFARDNHKCQICGKSVKEDTVLRVHHIGFWKDDKSSRMNNLLTVCTKCHTAKNHQEGGKLYGLNPKLNSFKGAAFMNTVRWRLTEELGNIAPVSITYGAETKLRRIERNIKKEHANDAYVMGEFKPKHKAHTKLFKKNRRNNRVLQKFRDAKFIDIRDGKTKSGKELGCNRVNRSEPRMSDKNERIYRGQKTDKGYVAIRRNRYFYQSGDIILFNGKKIRISGCQNLGTRVIWYEGKKQKTLDVRKVKLYRKAGGWCLLPA